jgi:N-acetylglutamate synthase-like GNAT family acetyltransferase
MRLPEKYAVRRATNADLDAIWSLISGVLHRYGIVANLQTTDQDLADIETSFAPDRGAFFVLLHEGTPVGTVALRLLSNHRAELCRMYLLEAHRGRGLGRLLLEHATAEAGTLGVRRLFLKTASVLTEAISLYRKAGFTLVQGAVAGGNCDVVMEKPLHPEE